MSPVLQELVRQQAATVERMRSLRTEIDSETRDGQISAENAEKLSKINAELRSVNDQVKLVQDADESIASFTKPAEARVGGAGMEGSSEARFAETTKNFENWLRTGRWSNGEKRQTYNIVIGAQNQNGIEEVRALSVGTDTAGGHTVAPLQAPDLYKFVRLNNSVMEAGAREIVTATGAPMDFPRMDDSGNEAQITAEGAAIPVNVDPAFSNVSIPVFKYTSPIVKVAWELVQDSAYDLSGELERGLGTRIGRKTGIDFLYGDGSAAPAGLDGVVAEANTAANRIDVTQASGVLSFTAAGSGVVDLDYKALVGLYRGINPVYQRNGSFLLGSDALTQIMLLTDSQNRPLWLPSTREGLPGTILGRPYVESAFFKGTGASAAWVDGDPIAFYGDFSHYYVRRAGEIQFVRLDERYADTAEAGFLVHARYGGASMTGIVAATRAIAKLGVDVA